MSPWQRPWVCSQIFAPVLQLRRNRAITRLSNSLWCALQDGITMLKLLHSIACFDGRGQLCWRPGRHWRH